MTTIARVNAALHKAGRLEQLARGRGYFYVYGGGAECWRSTMLITTSLTPFDTESVVRWIDELKGSKSNGTTA